MITVNDMRGLLDTLDKKYPLQVGYVALLVPPGPGDHEIEEFIQEIRGMGYAAFARTTTFGDEIVITDKVENGDAGSSWC
jgi:hypothetical protein